LSASIFTKNIDCAHRLAERLESGQVTINAWGMLSANMPFGGESDSNTTAKCTNSYEIGFKQSGFGKDGGAEALDDWTIVKAVKLIVPRL
jgi:aldehyde dehydrogenase (NAD+)